MSEPAAEPRPGPTGNAALFREMDEVPNDQEIADEAGFLQDAEFLVQAGEQLRVRRRAIAEAFPHAGGAKLAQILFARLACGRFVFGEFGGSKFQLEIAALGDRDGV